MILNINKKKLRTMALKEKKEHRWASFKIAERIALDHLMKTTYRGLKIKKRSAR